VTSSFCFVFKHTTAFSYNLPYASGYVFAFRTDLLDFSAIEVKADEKMHEKQTKQFFNIPEGHYIHHATAGNPETP